MTDISQHIPKPCGQPGLHTIKRRTKRRKSVTLQPIPGRSMPAGRCNTIDLTDILLSDSAFWNKF